MASVGAVADARQQALIAATRAATNRSLGLWRRMDFQNLDASWSALAPGMVAQVSAAQLLLARTSDKYTQSVAAADGFSSTRASVVPEAFAGIDGQGRDVEGVLFGAVTTTKTAVGAGWAEPQAFEAGAAYLAAIIKTVVADMGRSADMVSATGKGYTHYVRVVSLGACSRCAILAGKSSYHTAFKRHPACKCTAAPIRDDSTPEGLFDSPDAYFDSLSPAEQERVFTKAGAQSIRDGADVSKVVSARRGAKGIGYSGGGSRVSAPRGRFTKTTIGHRPDGTAVQVYSTSEGVTVRGEFGRAQARTSEVRRLQGARYSSSGRVRLMPETINEIAGDDLAVRQAFLRDAGYMQYMPKHGYDRAGLWMRDVEEQQRADRILVDRATRRFANFYLG